MRHPLQRVRTGAVVLASITLVAVLGYRLAGWSWLDSIYMVAITVSTVGYRELGEMSDPLKLFTVAVIVTGMSAAVYTVGGFLQLLFEGEIERSLGLVRMSRDIARQQDHVIICGLGRIGRLLACDLEAERRPFVVIDVNPDVVSQAIDDGWLAVHGDATEEEVLERAGIARARTVVTALPSDAANVFIALTARNMQPKLQIIARGESQSTLKKLEQAGADRVVMPAAIGAQRIAAMITRPTTVELLELVGGRGTVDVGVDEVPVTPDSPLAGRSIAEAEFGRRYGVLIVAIKRPDGQVRFSPAADYRLEPGDRAIVMGSMENLDRFRRAIQPDST